MILTTLLDPLEVKGLLLKNRIVMAPMQSNLATTQGEVTEDLVTHYFQRAKSLGLLVVEHSYITNDGKFSERQLGISKQSDIAGLRKLSSNVHSQGTPIVLQLNHRGMKRNADMTGEKPVYQTLNINRLESAEIERLTAAFENAAEIAMKSGFDGVEIHGAHGFLLNQFYSPLTNQRKDEYGGTLDDRIRFPLNIIRRVRAKIGERLLLYRLGSVDLDPAGTRIEDSQEFARKLEEAGVDILDISGGFCGSRPVQLQKQTGYFIPQAYKIKMVVKIPVIGVGGITNAKIADSIIQKGQVDLIAVGRALLQDPDWTVKAVNSLQEKKL